MTLATRTGKVAFQGALGANSHLACKQTVPNMDVLPCEDFDLAFAAIMDGEADLAVIPIENSSAGRVADMHRLLPDSGLHIIGEHFLPIVHTLVGLPGSNMNDIEEVYSHEQALSQCHAYLRSHNMRPVIFSDTAAAAQWLSTDGKVNQGAICAAFAAEYYGLQILDQGVNDRPQNTTRFLILSREADVPSLDTTTITSLLFRTRSEPASLYKALTSFATNNINITKLESYMVGDRFDVAQFYIDVVAHKDTHAFEIAFRDLTYFCADQGVRLMGSYPAHPYRQLSD